MNDQKKSQRGGFAVGLIIGLLIGLALALGVALYVTKVPVPFVNKVPQRTPSQDAAEAEKNKNWDPNSPLYGKNPAKPAASASGVVAPAPAVVAAPAPAAATRASAAPAVKGTTTAAAAAAADPFIYFVQAGAYGRTEDAEQQRAKLAMMGVEAKLSEREQSGRTVYRVRLGPFDKKTDAEGAKEKLDAAGVESALVRVQR